MHMPQQISCCDTYAIETWSVWQPPWWFPSFEHDQYQLLIFTLARTYCSINMFCFAMWHRIPAVVTCAQKWPDDIITITITEKLILAIVQLWTHKTVCKMGPTHEHPLAVVHFIAQRDWAACLHLVITFLYWVISTKDNTCFTNAL